MNLIRYIVLPPTILYLADIDPNELIEPSAAITTVLATRVSGRTPGLA